MLQNIKKRTEGFTIIEVLIVLAIAGLIMLIVFLAVPALQRNSANNGRRAEASRYATAANEFVTNGNDVQPTSSDAGAIATAVGKTKYISSSNFTVVTTVPGATSKIDTPNTARLVVGAECNGVFVRAKANSMAVQYGLDPATAACINV